MGELAQEDTQRGSRVDPAEDLLDPTGANNVEIIDAVRARGHPRDDRGQLRCGISRPGLDPLATETYVLVQQPQQPGLFSQFQQRHQTRVRHEVVLIEDRAVRAPGMRSLH